MVHCIIILRGHRFPCISFSEDHFGIANSVDPDEMPLNAAFHLGLHCLPMYVFRSHKGLRE